MEDREMSRKHKYGETKTTRIVMATVRHMTSSSGLRKFQATDFCWTEGTTQTLVDAKGMTTHCNKGTPLTSIKRFRLRPQVFNILTPYS